MIARPDKYEIPGNVPETVPSMRTTGDADKLSEVAAAMVVKAFCAAVGVVNFVMVKVTAAPAA